ncbi:MAG: hypothetical protein H6667_16895 [Ardenticatenaceae bacterium]|nr:hypothetical protein [Ardenticatenaceae bacterium]MCB9443129.1 hypothetical protein [Ardenticatenaceae bacterium]
MSLKVPVSKASNGKVSPRFKRRIGSFFRPRAGILLALLICALVFRAGSVNSSSGAIPTFSIQSVAVDKTVTIVTQNFPAGQDFVVTMGYIGTLGINGYLVGTTNSGAGGSFTTTYTIPAQLHGQYQIAIRLQSAQGYYSYNWFYNDTTGSYSPGVVGYTGIPTFDISSVKADESVTIVTKNFPANQTFTVTMGAMGTLGIGGEVVGTIESGTGGALTKTFAIPDKFKGAYQISIRAQTAHANPYYAYNWFYNNTTPSSSSSSSTTTTTTTTTTAVYSGIPAIHICTVERDKSVMFRTTNFPANQTFTVRMGPMWTAGIGGTVVGTFDSGAGGSFDKTFAIPANLAGSYRISIRMDTAHANPYYSYNWFYNNTASVCN